MNDAAGCDFSALDRCGRENGLEMDGIGRAAQRLVSGLGLPVKCCRWESALLSGDFLARTDADTNVPEGFRIAREGPLLHIWMEASFYACFSGEVPTERERKLIRLLWELPHARRSGRGERCFALWKDCFRRERAAALRLRENGLAWPYLLELYRAGARWEKEIAVPSPWREETI